MCTKFAASLGFESASIITINSEVATPSMYYKHRLDLKLFLQMDTGSKKKTNDLSIDVVDTMPAVHTQSGCDSTNSFSGIGKVKFFKTKCKDLRYYSAASMLGERDTKNNTVVEILEDLFCHVYGTTVEIDINSARFMLLLKLKKVWNYSVFF